MSEQPKVTAPFEETIATAVEAFVQRVNARAEADMLRGNPITGAHHRAIEAELEAIRTAKPEPKVTAESPHYPVKEKALRQGCECDCCDHGEGSDCGCDCHSEGACAYNLESRVKQLPRYFRGGKEVVELEDALRLLNSPVVHHREWVCGCTETAGVWSNRMCRKGHMNSPEEKS